MAPSALDLATNSVPRFYLWSIDAFEILRSRPRQLPWVGNSMSTADIGSVVASIETIAAERTIFRRWRSPASPSGASEEILELYQGLHEFEGPAFGKSYSSPMGMTETIGLPAPLSMSRL